MKIKKKYKSLFIIPISATKELTDIGWEFDSKKHMNNDVVQKLNNEFEMALSHDSDSYSGEGFKVDVFYMSEGEIESIFIRDYSDEFYMSELLLSLYKGSDEVEIFIPSMNDAIK